MDKVRKNTVKIAFASGVKAPVHLDVIRFAANVLKLPASDVHSIYKDENDRCFYIKFHEEPDFDCFVSGMEEEYRFEYGDGGSTVVKLEVASRLFRYVRIFNLPPEIEEKDIAGVLNQFGTIRQHVRERYPMSYGYAVYSGIRGVHMEIAKEIPANLYIGHHKARLFYEGLKNRCFHCKMEGHLKVECPKTASPKPSTSTASYSGVVAGAVANNATSSNNNPSQLTMTPLPLKNNRTSSNTKQQPSIQSNSADGGTSAALTGGKTNTEGERMELSTQSSTDNSSPTDKQSPRRGRSRTKKSNVEQQMQSLLSQLSGRSRSRSRSQQKGKEKNTK